MTIVEKILLAAFELESQGHSPFSAEELVVRAWQDDDALFGLQGYSEKYPDSNRILSNIMGNKGLRGRGWIEKVGEKQYRLTASGSKMAHSLADSDEITATRAGLLDRKEILVIRRMLESPANKKRNEHNEHGIIFRDACSFWGISSYSDASTVETQFKIIRDVLQDLERAVVESKSGAIVLPNIGISINKIFAVELAKTHEYLKEKFDRELEALKER